jgi:hypothetical protein
MISSQKRDCHRRIRNFVMGSSEQQLHQLLLSFLRNGWTEALGSGQENKERPYLLQDLIKFKDTKHQHVYISQEVQ